MYNYSNLYLDIIGCLTIASMTPTMIFRMLSLPTVFDLHDGSTLSTLSMVDYMLDPTIRKSHSVLSLHALHTQSGKDLASHHNNLHHDHHV